ncbi:MAG: hypothetical protein SangKO_004580 [Sandaracinaceae bacterium]
MGGLAMGREASRRVGSIELGNFQLVGLLGRGSFAEAYLADQIGTGRHAVVKIAHEHLRSRADGAGLERRFVDEVCASARVLHPNLATIYTAGETSDGLPAIAMEFVPGDTLESCLERSAPLRTRELAYVCQLASVLSTIHRFGVVHRDVSPRNVMVTRDHDATPKVKLLDFGIAKLEGAQDMMAPMGTPRYAAPEQIRGSASPQSDLYSLGAILWWALTGRPFLEEHVDLGALVDHQLSMVAAPDPRSIREEISPGLAELAMQLLSPRPEARPSADDVRERWPQLIAEARRWRRRRGTRAVSSQNLPVTRTLRVLVIDPDPVKRCLVRGFTERLGCHVAATADPREATRGLLGGHDVAVLGTDLIGVDAARVGQHLREHFPAQRLVLVSNHDDPVVVPADAGADLSLTIPGELLRLADYLHALQTRSRGGDGTPIDTLRPHEAVSRTILDSWRQRPNSELRGAIERFLGVLPSSIASLDGLDVPDGGALEAEVVDACRAIEAQATTLGALHLARLAKSLLMLLEAGEMPDPGAFVAELEQEYERVFKQLLAILRDLPTTDFSQGER